MNSPIIIYSSFSLLLSSYPISSRPASRLLVSLLRLVSSHAVASCRAIIISIIYHDYLAHPLIVLSLPFTVALILRRSYPYHHRHFIPRLDGENELNKTARPSVSSNGTPISATAIAKSNSTTGGNRDESTPPRDEKDEPPPSQQS